MQNLINNNDKNYNTSLGDTKAEVIIGRVGKVSDGPFVPQIVNKKLWGKEDIGQDGSWFALNYDATRITNEKPKMTSMKSQIFLM